MSSRTLRESPPATGSTVTINGKDYIIAELLGSGMTANVVVAMEINTQQRVALKIFSKRTRMNAVTREIKALLKCDSPNVIRLLDWDMRTMIGAEKRMVLVTSYCPNGELFEIAQREKFAEEDAKPLMLQILRGIQHVHEKNLAHRDIKLDNILIDQNNNLVLADFGFAREDEQLCDILGTDGYMAPEIVQNLDSRRRSFYSKKVDIFAAGVIYFSLLAGFPPFANSNAEDWWYDKMLYGRWNLFWRAHERTHNFTDAQKRVIELMLQRNVRKRPSASELISHDYFSGQTKTKTELQDAIRARIVGKNSVEGESYV